MEALGSARRVEVIMASRVKALMCLGVSGLVSVACIPGTPPGPQPPLQKRVAPPVEAELRGAPPPGPAPEAGKAAGMATAVSTPRAVGPTLLVDDSPLGCVEPTDPELDKESAWSREIGQRLERALPRLAHCSLNLPPDDTASITLRFVYGKNGSPTSQHVVTSTSNACSASQCLEQELGRIRSPELLIDKASIDLTLTLARDSAPKRVSEPVDPLAPDEGPVNADSCVDREIARLSRASVRDVVSGSYDELQRCYGEALMRDHSATGRVTFEFVIGQRGSVSDAWARDASLRDCQAIDCMLSQFRALSFPEPVGRSVRVIYPISYVVEQQPVTLQ
jgi:hypothetical protein